MTAFGLFLSYYAFRIHFTFHLFPVLSMTASFLSAIILVYFYRGVLVVVRLLPIFIGLLTVLFIGSAIAEAVQFGYHTYVLVMKSSLYFFCILKPIEHYCLLLHKLERLRK
jgi:ABC-type transport system involved in cytochrome c biogenesis permease component